MPSQYHHQERTARGGLSAFFEARRRVAKRGVLAWRSHALGGVNWWRSRRRRPPWSGAPFGWRMFVSGGGY